uniref:CD99 antigen-like protein 2 n=1 Tax=Labrus bergylta TaxID=56723 RepID=A0A3Q3E5T5_9LABR
MLFGNSHRALLSPPLSLSLSLSLRNNTRLFMSDLFLHVVLMDDFNCLQDSLTEKVSVQPSFITSMFYNEREKARGGERGRGQKQDQINQYDDNSGEILSHTHTHKHTQTHTHTHTHTTTAEVGTIAGIASAVVMALVGAVSSYISYQKKKLCFGIQRE